MSICRRVPGSRQLELIKYHLWKDISQIMLSFPYRQMFPANRGSNRRVGLDPQVDGRIPGAGRANQLFGRIMKIKQRIRASGRSFGFLLTAIVATVATQSVHADDKSSPQVGSDAAKEIAAQIAQLPAWMAKSSREGKAIGDGKVSGPDFTKLFSKNVAQIAMRDGAELHTEIYAPLDQKEALPIILVRSPYGLSPDKYGYSAWLREYLPLLVDGYILVFQDTRGRAASTGQYVTLMPLHDPAVSNGVDDSTDTYDTIDWIVKHVPSNNGRVGMGGFW